jgi:hypothetical protein
MRTAKILLVGRVPASCSERPGRPRVSDVPGGLGRTLRPGQHGSEQIYDLRGDTLETVNFTGSVDGGRVVDLFRRMLLKLQTDNPGSIEVENAYLRAYRQWLRSIVEESPSPR